MVRSSYHAEEQAEKFDVRGRRNEVLAKREIANAIDGNADNYYRIQRISR